MNFFLCFRAYLNTQQQRKNRIIKLRLRQKKLKHPDGLKNDNLFVLRVWLNIFIYYIKYTSEQRPLSVPSLAKQVEFSFFPQGQAQIEDMTLPPYIREKHFVAYIMSNNDIQLGHAWLAHK